MASSKNAKLLVNIPKRGAFAGEVALNSDLAFSGRYAYAGNNNGFIYSNDIQRGFDVFEVKDPRINPAKRVTFDELNPQSQPLYKD